MDHWILKSDAACCPWPQECNCRPRGRALQDLDLSTSGDAWEMVLADLAAAR